MKDSSLPIIEERLSQLYFILGRLGLENGAFKQLTRKYLAHTFNPDVVNVDSVKYRLTNAVPNAYPVQLADVNLGIIPMEPYYPQIPGRCLANRGEY